MPIKITRHDRLIRWPTWLKQQNPIGLRVEKIEKTSDKRSSHLPYFRWETMRQIATAICLFLVVLTKHSIGAQNDTLEMELGGFFYNCWKCRNSFLQII